MDDTKSSGRQCARRPGCGEAGEFRAPGVHAPSFDGPGDWRWLCLGHVREFNAGYDWFEGMSPDEILAAQSPIAGWRNEARAFRADAGVELGAAVGRLRRSARRDRGAGGGYPGAGCRASGDDAVHAEERDGARGDGARPETDLHGLRKRYSDAGAPLPPRPQRRRPQPRGRLQRGDRGAISCCARRRRSLEGLAPHANLAAGEKGRYEGNAAPGLVLGCQRWSLA